jgi:hypothetical protein
VRVIVCNASNRASLPGTGLQTDCSTDPPITKDDRHSGQRYSDTGNGNRRNRNRAQRGPGCPGGDESQTPTVTNMPTTVFRHIGFLLVFQPSVTFENRVPWRGFGSVLDRYMRNGPGDGPGPRKNRSARWVSAPRRWGIGIRVQVAPGSDKRNLKFARIFFCGFAALRETIRGAWCQSPRGLSHAASTNFGAEFIADGIARVVNGLPSEA